MPRPAPSRSIACSTSMCAESTRIATCGSSSRIVLAASSPSVVWVGGIRMSTMATSGCSRRTSSIRPDTSLTCLIVDDSPQFFEAARQLLADDGITVVGFAATSDQAVSETLALRPDVALVDVDLGGESGFDVAQRLAGLRN